MVRLEAMHPDGYPVMAAGLSADDLRSTAAALARDGFTRVCLITTETNPDTGDAVDTAWEWVTACSACGETRSVAQLLPPDGACPNCGQIDY